MSAHRGRTAADYLRGAETILLLRFVDRSFFLAVRCGSGASDALGLGLRRDILCMMLLIYGLFLFLLLLLLLLLLLRLLLAVLVLVLVLVLLRLLLPLMLLLLLWLPL